MKTEKVRVGVIGVAVQRHPQVHLRALKSMEDVELVAFCDVDGATLERACKEYGVKDGFLSHRQMLEKAQMDAVWVVCNWRFTHEVALDCLKAGVNSFLEKPPGLSAQECRELAEAAEKSACKAMVGFNRRFNCVISEARRLVEGGGATGPEGSDVIRVVHSDYGKGQSSAVLRDRQGRPVPPILVDALHHVDCIRYICGEVEEVMSANACHYSENLDSFHAIIKFKNGSIGQINSNYHALKVERLSLFARNAWACVEGIHDQISGGKVYVNGCWHDLKGEALMGRTDVVGFWDECRHFINCVKEDKPVAYPASNLREAVKTMELVEAILAGG